MYFMTPNNWGPCGCMLEGKPSHGSANVYVNVTDLSTTIAKATKLGATVVTPRTEIEGGHGFFAHVRLPDGNVFGLYCRH